MEMVNREQLLPVTPTYWQKSSEFSSKRLKNKRKVFPTMCSYAGELPATVHCQCCKSIHQLLNTKSSPLCQAVPDCNPQVTAC